MLKLLRKHLEEKPARTLMMFLGAVLVGASFFVGDGRQPFAVAALLLGGVLILTGGALPLILSLNVKTPAGSMELNMRPEGEGSALLADPTATDREEESDEVDAMRYALANEMLPAILRPTGPLADAEFRLFIWDEDEGKLLPAFEPESPTRRSRGWEPGQGATGAAWKLEQYVAVSGAQIYDETYGLTPEQQERYRELTAVAAMPVTDDEGDVIAILSASTKAAETALLSEDGFDAHLAMADKVARVLIDLLRWFDE